MKERRRREKKERTEKVLRGDRSKRKRVPIGKGEVRTQVVNVRRVGKKWGDRVATTKPCTKGANRQLAKKKAAVVKKVKTGTKGTKGSKGKK